MSLHEGLIQSEIDDQVTSDTGMRRRKIFAHSLEIPIFLIMVSLMLSGTAIGNILLYRTCVHSLEYSDSDCRIYLAPDKSSTNNTIEQAVQKYAAFVGTVRTIIDSLAPATLALFLGVWSNTYGRKPLIVWPLLGLSISSMAVVLYAMIESLGPWWFIVTSIPMSLSGAFTSILTGSFCYINDVTTTEARTIRLAIFGGSISAGSIVGSMLSAPLLLAVGNVYFLLIVSAILVTAYAYANIVLAESVAGAIEGNIITIFDISHVKIMANECFKKRPQYGRAQILLMAFSNFLLMVIVYGLAGLEYGYTREKVHWSLKDYNTFSALNTFVSFIGGLVFLGLFQHVLRFSDLLLALAALLCAIGEYIIKAFAVSSWHMYLAAVIAIPKGLASFLIRSLLTKILPPDVVATVFTLMSSLDALCPLLSPVMYSSLYVYSISTFPGSIYLLSSGIVMTCCVMLGFVMYYRRNLSTEYQALVTNESISEE